MNSKLVYLVFLLISTKGYSQCSSVTDYDGNVYNTVVIGSQCWMQENLKVTRFNNGDTIREIEDSATWANITYSGITPPLWCHTNDTLTSSHTYGNLYNWYAAADPRHLCPAGWHLPSDTDWHVFATSLDEALDSATTYNSYIESTSAGGAMKATTLWWPPNTGATNSSGFTALPAASRSYSGYLDTQRTYSTFWCSTFPSWDSGIVWVREVENISADLYVLGLSKFSGFSLRCVNNSPIGIINIARNSDYGVQIFPNPSSGIFTIKTITEQDEKSEIEILDVVGRRVDMFNNPQHLGTNQFNYSLTTKGIYFIHMIGSNSSNVTRLVIE